MTRRISAFSLLVLLVGLALMQCQSPFEPDEANYSVLPRTLTPAEIELAAAASLGSCVLNHLFSLNKVKMFPILPVISNRRSQIS